MQIGSIATLTLAAMALASCASTPKRITHQDIDFMRGCWAAKDSAGTNFLLRLLPSGPDRRELSGYMHNVHGGQMTPEVHITLSRDGSRAVVVKGDQTTEYVSDPMANSVSLDGTHRASWSPVAPNTFGGIMALGKDDKLVLTVMTSDGGPIFDGERDGCD